MLRISRKIDIYQEKFRFINKIWDISIIFEIYQEKTDYIKKSTYLVKISHPPPPTPQKREQVALSSLPSKS